MPLRNIVRQLLLAPFQITIFLWISLPLAFFAAITTFFSVIFLSSRLLLVYVDLTISFLFTPSPSSSTVATVPDAQVHHSPPPYYSSHMRRSPPRSPPRVQYNYSQQQSFTAPSSPNISRKRLGASAVPAGTILYGGQHSPPGYSQAPPVAAPAGGAAGMLSPSVAGGLKGLPKGFGGGAKSSPSTPYAGSGPSMSVSPSFGTSGKQHGRRGSVKIGGSEGADAYGSGGDYFSSGMGGAGSGRS